MSDAIVALRELFANPTQDDGWNEAFCELLRKAHQNNDEVCLSYCEEHAKSLQKPIKRVYSLAELNRWVEIAPFAFFVYDMDRHELGRDEWMEIVGSPSLERVWLFDLNDSMIGTNVCRALANCPHLKNLRELDITDNYITDVECILLADSPYLESLEVLRIDCEHVFDEGRAALERTQWKISEPIKVRRKTNT